MNSNFHDNGVRGEAPENMQEIKILISCARMHPDNDYREQFRRLFDVPIDWDYLVSAAHYHRFIPFLFNAIKSFPEVEIPPAVREDVSRIFYQTVKWNMMVTGELFSIIDNLRDEGVSSIPFKGPVLAQALYGDISHRQFDDLDILIQRKDFQKTKEYLIAAGYQPEQQLTLMQESVMVRSQHHFQFSNTSSGFFVEIHWEFSPVIYSFNLHPADVWERVHSVDMSGHEVFTLSPADMLLVLCEHGSRHYWKRLLWVSDIARLVECREIDWLHLEQLARKLGSERVLLLGISLAKTLFYAEVPPSVSQRIRDDPEVLRLTNMVLDEIYSRKDAVHHLSRTCDEPDINEELLYLQTRERFRDRLRYYIRRMTSPPREDLNFFLLPEGFYAFYPIVRIGRLMRKYKIKAWKWI